ncbi:MAG: hypothetical protein Q8K75_04100 [Chlamydiales bacterium]|nr:hypothetical protein [Chlamydiales bacterium]
MRGIYLILLIAFVGVGSWWLHQNNTVVHGLVQDYSGKKQEAPQFLALEARYTPDQIMEAHRSELPLNRSNDKLEPALKFFPYLLLDVTYNQSDKRNREGVMLWSMDDGEIITNTQSWEASKGFGALLAAGADQGDFLVVKALAARGGKVKRDQLIRSLGVDSARADDWLESARKKGLVSLDGNMYKLNTSNVNVAVQPATIISQRLVTKPYNHVKRQATKYTKEQISEAARVAFAPEVTVRSVREVFLPVYSVSLTNNDGSVQTTYWNALNGQRYVPKGSTATRQ